MIIKTNNSMMMGLYSTFSSFSRTNLSSSSSSSALKLSCWGMLVLSTAGALTATLFLIPRDTATAAPSNNHNSNDTDSPSLSVSASVLSFFQRQQRRLSSFSLYTHFHEYNKYIVWYSLPLLSSLLPVKSPSHIVTLSSIVNLIFLYNNSSFNKKSNRINNNNNRGRTFRTRKGIRNLYYEEEIRKLHEMMNQLRSNNLNHLLLLMNIIFNDNNNNINFDSNGKSIDTNNNELLFNELIQCIDKNNSVDSVTIGIFPNYNNNNISNRNFDIINNEMIVNRVVQTISTTTTTATPTTTSSSLPNNNHDNDIIIAAANTNDSTNTTDDHKMVMIEKENKLSLLFNTIGKIKKLKCLKIRNNIPITTTTLHDYDDVNDLIDDIQNNITTGINDYTNGIGITRTHSSSSTTGKLDLSILTYTFKQRSCCQSLTSLVLHDVVLTTTPTGVSNTNDGHNNVASINKDLFLNAIQNLHSLKCFYYRINKSSIIDFNFFDDDATCCTMNFFVTALSTLPALQKIYLCMLSFNNSSNSSSGSSTSTNTDDSNDHRQQRQRSILSMNSLGLLLLGTPFANVAALPTTATATATKTTTTKYFSKLKKVTLFDLGITDKEICYIFKSTSTTSTNDNDTFDNLFNIETLNLNCNHISNNGLKAISKFLIRNKKSSLKKLKLSYNNFNQESLISMVKDSLTITPSTNDNNSNNNNSKLQSFHCKGVISSSPPVNDSNNLDMNMAMEMNTNGNDSNKNNKYDQQYYNTIIKPFQEMIENNFILNNIAINDTIDNDPILQFYLKLNKAGRRSLLLSSSSSRQIHHHHHINNNGITASKYIRILHSVCNDLKCLYYFIRSNPTICNM